MIPREMKNYYYYFITSPARDIGGAKYWFQLVCKSVTLQCIHVANVANVPIFLLTNHAQVFAVVT